GGSGRGAAMRGAVFGAGAGTGAARQEERRRRRTGTTARRRRGRREIEGAGPFPPPLEALEESASRGGIGEDSLPSLERYVQAELETSPRRRDAARLAEMRVDLRKPRDEAVETSEVVVVRRVEELRGSSDRDRARNRKVLLQAEVARLVREGAVLSAPVQ